MVKAKGRDSEVIMSKYTYVKTDVVRGCNYFSTKVDISPVGIIHIHPPGALTTSERKILEKFIPSLNNSEEMANQFDIHKLNEN